MDSDLGLPEAALSQPLIATVSERGVDYALESITHLGFPLWAYALVALSQLPVNFASEDNLKSPFCCFLSLKRKNMIKTAPDLITQQIFLFPVSETSNLLELLNQML